MLCRRATVIPLRVICLRTPYLYARITGTQGANGADKWIEKQEKKRESVIPCKTFTLEEEEDTVNELQRTDYTVCLSSLYIDMYVYKKRNVDMGIFAEQAIPCGLRYFSSVYLYSFDNLPLPGRITTTLYT